MKVDCSEDIQATLPMNDEFVSLDENQVTNMLKDSKIELDLPIDSYRGTTNYTEEIIKKTLT